MRTQRVAYLDCIRQCGVEMTKKLDSTGIVVVYKINIDVRREDSLRQ